MDLRLNNLGDLEITQGDLSWVRGTEALAQRLRFALRHFRGEWELDTEFGVPWYEQVLRKGVSANTLAATFKEVILSTDGVQGLESFSLEHDRANRRLHVRFSVKATSGTLALDEVLP